MNKPPPYNSRNVVIGDNEDAFDYRKHPPSCPRCGKFLSINMEGKKLCSNEECLLYNIPQGE